MIKRLLLSLLLVISGFTGSLMGDKAKAPTFKMNMLMFGKPTSVTVQEKSTQEKRVTPCLYGVADAKAESMGAPYFAITGVPGFDITNSIATIKDLRIVRFRQ